MEDITEALWGAKVSSSTVSELNQKIYGKIEEWRKQPISGEHPYVFVDGVYLKLGAAKFKAFRYWLPLESMRKGIGRFSALPKAAGKIKNPGAIFL